MSKSREREFDWFAAWDESTNTVVSTDIHFGRGIRCGISSSASLQHSVNSSRFAAKSPVHAWH